MDGWDWDGMGWVGSLGLVEYRAPYGANKRAYLQGCQDNFAFLHCLFPINTISSQVSGLAQLPDDLKLSGDQESRWYKSGGNTSMKVSPPIVQTNPMQ